MTSATLAVHVIKALFRHDDKEALGLTFDEEILDDDHEGGGGLSRGARIGIGVGATIAGLMLIGLLVWVCLRRRKARSKQTNPPMEVTTVGASGFNTGLPPPAHEHPERRGIPEEEECVGDSEDGGEIHALRAQKAAIQRRIEELERVETPDDARSR